MSEDLDKYGRPIDPAERMQQVMLGFMICWTKRVKQTVPASCSASSTNFA